MIVNPRKALAVCLTAGLALVTVLIPGPLHAATPAEIAAELSGTETFVPTTLPTRDPAAQQLAGSMLPVGGLLLIAESTNDRVMAFDPATGDLVDADFIPADPTNLSTPIHAVLSPDGASILVSDQLEDVVQQYDLDGTYIGVFAPAGGVNTAILDNIRGVGFLPNGNLLVSVGGGANDDAIAEFDSTGAYVGNFVANGAGGLDSPFDVTMATVAGGSIAAGDYLVGGITSDALHIFDSTGGFVADLAPVDTFPEQVIQIANGNVLSANFIGGQEGIMEFDSAGGIVGIYDPASIGGYRGVYELPNGNILTTNGGGVHEIDRTGALVETKIAGVSGRFISFAGPTAPPEPPTPVVEIPTLSGWGLLALALVLALLATALLRRRTA